MMGSFHPETEAERFNRKAHRVARALAACPSARAEELVPFLELFQARKAIGRMRSVADMMCGNGYLARLLLPRAERLVLVDASVGMLDACSPHLRSGAGATILVTQGAFREPQLAQLGPFDMVTCLAGLHHVFEASEKNGVNRSASIALQAEVIGRWVNLLTEDGMILLGDVAEDPAVRVWTRDAQGTALARPSPASFFGHFVARESVVGHDAQFLSTDLLHHLESRGLRCDVAVRETPWRFSSSRQAAWYLGEKFAIGPDASDPTSLSPRAERLIMSAVDEHLGATEIEHTFAIGWRLAYLTVGASRSPVITEGRAHA